ncbi:MAG: hypothetical protein P4L91_08005 [Burkholderiaceae bacterium]|nr:hypothetical protein [Burkholderiaceae bacterium]
MQAHEEKETLSVDVFGPAHADRTTTTIFVHSKAKLEEREHGRCWICGCTAEEAGHPLEAHHLGIERQFAEAAIEWGKVKADFPNFDWANFDQTKPYTFVDNMLAQGTLLCKPHHTGKFTGIHSLPYSLWIMQRYLTDGVQFSPNEVIHHDTEAVNG